MVSLERRPMSTSSRPMISLLCSSSFRLLSMERIWQHGWQVKITCGWSESSQKSSSGKTKQ